MLGVKVRVIFRVIYLCRSSIPRRNPFSCFFLWLQQIWIFSKACPNSLASLTVCWRKFKALALHQLHESEPQVLSNNCFFLEYRNSCITWQAKDKTSCSMDLVQHPSGYSWASRVSCSSCSFYAWYVCSIDPVVSEQQDSVHNNFFSSTVVPPRNGTACFGVGLLAKVFGLGVKWTAKVSPSGDVC